MKFEENQYIGEGIAKWFGYVLSYAIFTTILYFIVSFVRHENLLWWQVALITLAIVIIAKAVHWWLS